MLPLAEQGILLYICMVMSASPGYLFTSQRLGFRAWREDDLAAMAAINADPAVMEFFPALQSEQETRQFITRMNLQMERHGFCYYALDRLDTSELIGFTGLSYKDFEAAFTPCVDIGWRLATSAWNQGFATEAAKRCIQYGFNELQLKEIVSMAPVINVKSIAVMQKTGMHFERYFEHPLLPGDERLRTCALYRVTPADLPDEI